MQQLELVRPKKLTAEEVARRDNPTSEAMRAFWDRYTAYCEARGREQCARVVEDGLRWLQHEVAKIPDPQLSNGVIVGQGQPVAKDRSSGPHSDVWRSGHRPAEWYFVPVCEFAGGTGYNDFYGKWHRYGRVMANQEKQPPRTMRMVVHEGPGETRQASYRRFLCSAAMESPPEQCPEEWKDYGLYWEWMELFIGDWIWPTSQDCYNSASARWYGRLSNSIGRDGLVYPCAWEC